MYIVLLSFLVTSCSSSLSDYNRIQNCFCDLVGGGDDLFPTPSHFPADAKSPSYRYAHGKCSDELLSLVPTAQTFTVKTRLAISRMLNRFPWQDGCFTPKGSLWHTHPRGYFHVHYNLNFLKFRVNQLSICHIIITFTF